MSWIRTLLEAYKKNIKRMFKSKITLASIFIGPFIILLLIQGAYQTTTMSLDVGVINVDGSQDNLIETLRAQGFAVYGYQTLEPCVDEIKKGYIDFCINTANDRVTFYVDESKISLVTMLKRIISNTISEQSNQIRQQVSNELNNQITSATNNLNTFGSEFESFIAQDPVQMLEEINDQIRSGTTDIDSARDDLDDMEQEVLQIEQQTRNDLIRFENELRDVESQTQHQLNTIRNIEEYNRNCEDKIYIDEYYLMYNASFDEIRDEYLEVGECLCVDYYRDNLLEVQRDLEDVLEAIDDAQDTINEAQQRNAEFSDTTLEIIRTQRGVLINKQNDALQTANNLDNEISDLRSQLNNFETSINEMNRNAADMQTFTQNMDKALVNPLSLEIVPINKQHELIVFLFPMMFFFILVFVSLLFSGIFTYSEMTNKARARNILSPTKQPILLLGMFLSLLTLILVQASLLLVLGRLAFSFPLSMAIFGKVILTTLTVTGFYIIIGMLLGIAIRSQLLVTFTIIGLSVISLLYSTMLTPANVMTQFAQLIVKINPFSIGVEATQKTILYNVPFDVFSYQLGGIGVVVVLLAITIGWIYHYRSKNI